MKKKIFTLFAALTLSAGALFASDTAVGGIYSQVLSQAFRYLLIVSGKEQTQLIIY